MFDSYTSVRTADSESTPARLRSSVYVYEAPVRAWHWINAVLILVLIGSGYLIASPLPTLSGEASAHYQMGYIRFAHFAAAQLFIVAFAYRIYRGVRRKRACAAALLHPVLAAPLLVRSPLRAGLVPLHRQEPEEVCRPQSARQSRDGRALHAPEPVHDRDWRCALFARRRRRLLVDDDLRMGVSHLAEQPAGPYAPSPGHVGHGDLHLCCTSTPRSARTSCRARPCCRRS